jgi:hypothetical protein
MRLASFGIETNYVTHFTKGTNLQNVEKQIRKLYKADPGKKLIQRDQSGAEALIVAYLCRDGKYRSLFLNGIKPHVYIALHLFANIWEQKLSDGKDTKLDINEVLNLDISSLKLHPRWKDIDKCIKSSDNWGYGERYYYIGKKVCHASNYAMRKNTFVMSLLEESRGKIVIAPKEGERYLETFHALFPEIREWHREIEQQINETHTLYNLQGYPREFTEEITGTNIKDAYAFIPQSTVATISNTAYTNMQTFIEENDVDWDLLAQTHDSIMAQCPDSEIEVNTCNQVMKGLLEQELKSPRGEIFRMKSEGAVGYNWAPWKKDTNEQGLVTLNE